MKYAKERKLVPQICLTNPEKRVATLTNYSSLAAELMRNLLGILNAYVVTNNSKEDFMVQGRKKTTTRSKRATRRKKASGRS